MKLNYNLLLVAILFSFSAYSQKVINVPSDYTTIQTALNSANTNDTVFVQPGTYYENIIWPETNGIKLISTGDTTNTFIDGSNTGRVINVIYSIIDTNTIIQGFTIKNGYTSGKGAGIQVSNGGLKLNEICVENCLADESAGGIYCSGTSFIIHNSTIISNSSDFIGGIRCETNSSEIFNTKVIDNVSTGDNRKSSNAGGVSIIGTLDDFDPLKTTKYKVANCYFKGNLSESYGGGLSVSGSGKIVNSEFLRNAAHSFYGAAISIEGVGIIDSVYVHDNGWSTHGTIFMHNGKVTLSNSIICNNQSTGIRVERYGNYILKNTIISGCSLAIATGRDNSTGDIKIDNCKLIRNRLEIEKDFFYDNSVGISITEHAGSVLINNSTISGFTRGISGHHKTNKINIKGSIFSANENGIYNTTTNMVIDSSLFSINENAIINEVGGVLSVSNSDFLNNEFGINNLDDGYMLNAENNYWGHNTGAYHPSSNASGLGDSVNVYVDINPFSENRIFVDYQAPIFIEELINNKDQSVTILWNDFNIQDIQSIRIYYKGVDSLYWHEKVVTNKMIDTISNLSPYVIYQFKLSYITTSGVESVMSNNELIYTDDDRTIFYVPADFETIQRAINCASRYDTIRVSPGIYYESIVWSDTSNIILIGDTINPSTTIIDGKNSNTCISFGGYSNSSATINGFTVQNGYNKENGGGILLNKRYLTVDLFNCILKSNRANKGGAICSYEYNSYLNLNKVLIFDNEAQTYGASIYCRRATLNINSTTIVNNYCLNADTTTIGNGGVYEGGKALIYNSIIWNDGIHNIVNKTNSSFDQGIVLLYYSCLKYGDSFDNGQITGTTWHKDGINVYPEFSDTTNFDFSLKLNSPCIDTGDPDIISNLCSRIDMGYFESNYGQRINFADTALSICQGDSLHWKGSYYSETGTFYYELNTGISCDSIYELNLTVNPSFFSQVSSTICQGDSLSWEGGFYTEPGKYYKDYTTISGCDSTFELELFVNPSYLISDTFSICEGDSLLWHNQYYKTQGQYYVTKETVFGCDSLFELILDINPIYYKNVEMSICEGDTLTFGTQSLIEAGVYQETFQSVTGCDSVVVLTLSVNAVFKETVNATICDGETFIFGDQRLTKTGEYTETFQSVGGCDSVVILTLNVSSVEIEVDQDGNSLTSKAVDAEYQWVTCGNEFTHLEGETNQTFVATENGDYAVIIAQNSCVDTSSCYTITGISVLENTFEKEFVIYPNPTDGILVIDTKTTYESISVSVLNINGLVVLRKEFQHQPLLELNLSGNPSGLYYLLFNSNDCSSKYKIIKK